MAYRHDMRDKTSQQQAIVRKKDENDKLSKESNAALSYVKNERKAIRKKADIQARILVDNGFRTTKGTMKILDELWDETDTFKEENIPNIIAKIKEFQKEVVIKNRILINEATKDIESFGLKKDDDYSIGFAASGEENYISLTFRLKGNKKIVEHFESKNWIIDRRYKNDDGSPSHYKSDWFGKNFDFKYVMIVMKYIVDSINGLMEENFIE